MYYCVFIMHFKTILKAYLLLYVCVNVWIYILHGYFFVKTYFYFATIS